MTLIRRSSPSRKLPSLRQAMNRLSADPFVSAATKAATRGNR